MVLWYNENGIHMNRRFVVRVYLDNCCYNRPYDDQSQPRISLEAQAKLFVQERIKNGTIELASSYMLVQKTHEIVSKQKEMPLNGLLRTIRMFISIRVTRLKRNKSRKRSAHPASSQPTPFILPAQSSPNVIIY